MTMDVFDIMPTPDLYCFSETVKEVFVITLQKEEFLDISIMKS